MNAKKLLEELAAGVHGAVGAANLLIAAYNYKKGNPKRAIFHLGLVVWEGLAFHEHLKEMKHDKH